jgi:hypothetical protein
VRLDHLLSKESTVCTAATTLWSLEPVADPHLWVW